jgi:hypothetical protein
MTTEQEQSLAAHIAEIREHALALKSRHDAAHAKMMTCCCSL